MGQPKDTVIINPKQPLIDLLCGNNRLNLFATVAWFYSLDGEEWREIPETGEKYFISSYGRVLSLCYDRIRFLKPFLCGKANNQYLYVELSGYGLFSINRLVATAFCEKPPAAVEVHHKDRNPLNNRADNLVWLTKEQHLEAHRKLRAEAKSKENGTK